MVDSSKWSVIEAGLKCVQGKGDRQLDQPQGRRGEVPAPGPAGPPLRCRRGRDGLRRAGAGRSAVEDKVRICQPGLQAADRRGRHCRRRTSSSIPTFSPSAPASRSTTTTRSISSRPRGEIKQRLPGAKISGGVSNVSFSFRGNDAVREAMHAAFLYHAIRAGLDMGIVNAGQLAVYEEIPPATCCEHVEDVLLNRRPDATERLIEFAETVKQKGAADGRSDSAWRDGDGRGAAVSTRWSTASSTTSRQDVEEARQKYPTCAGDHRRAADGRHEGRRRPVRRRQDVSAAGGQERPRDEEGGGLSAAVHGSRKSAKRPAAQVARQDPAWPPSRATSTTSARTSSASCWAATITR